MSTDTDQLYRHIPRAFISSTNCPWCSAAPGEAPEDYEELEAVVEEEEAPAATVHQNTDTGVVDLDIDVSVLGQPRPPPLVTKLLGANWQVRLGRHCGGGNEVRVTCLRLVVSWVTCFACCKVTSVIHGEALRSATVDRTFSC